MAEAKLSCRACVVFFTVAEILVLLEKLSQYLGVVELHLVRDISMLQSEAQKQLTRFECEDRGRV